MTMIISTQRGVWELYFTFHSKLCHCECRVLLACAPPPTSRICYASALVLTGEEWIYIEINPPEKEQHSQWTVQIYMWHRIICLR